MIPLEIAGGSAVTQRRKSQSVGLLMIVVFSAVLLWALAAMVWPAPGVYANYPLVTVDGSARVDEGGIVVPELNTGDASVLANGSGLTLTKTVDDDTPNPGQLITYTITISNSGTSNATDALISDTLPSGLTLAGPVTLDPPSAGTTGTPPILASGVTITAGESVTVTFPVTVNTGLTSGTVITNTAAVTSTEVSPPVTGTVSITIANVAPVASDMTLSTHEDTPLTSTLSASDANGDGLIYDIFINPSHGGVTITDTLTGSFVYTSTEDYNGIDTFTYIVTDSGSLTDTATVTITVQAVNDPPVANDDVYNVNEGDILTVTFSAGVLANDTDIENDTLTTTLVSAPSHGTLDLNPDGSFTYVHDGETDSDHFTYQAHDGTDYSNVATATINIQLFDPVITAITVTSASPTYFYAPPLDVDAGGQVFFNSVFGEGGGQTITVTISFTDAYPYNLTGSPAFGDPPGSDISGPPWTLTYTIEMGANSEPNRVFTVTDKAGLTDTAVITFTRDNVDPIVEFTDVTNPGYDSGGGELDTDGSNWYDKDDFPSGNWTFTSTTSDDGAGRASCSAFWDHSNDTYDHTTGCTLDGDGSFSSVNNDDDGTVTVTVTITDHVGNSASNLVVFSIDNTKPTIYPGSPPIVEGSPYLYANDLTVYYGDEMGTASQAFTVQGNAQDSGVGLDYVAYSAALNQGASQDSTHLENWYRDYTANRNNTTSGVITVTVYDRVGNFATQTFTYTRDITSPDIYYGSPSVVEDSDYLYAEGTTVYYSNQMGGISQSFTVQGNAADNGGGAGLWRATFSSPDLNDPGDDLILPDWSGIYDVESSDSGTGPITVRVYDNVSNWSEKTFNYVEDTTAPTVKLTNVTDPGYDFAGDELDDDGSNWYNDGDFIAGIWEFTSDTADDGAGLASGTAFWDHSGHQTVRPLDCGTDGDGFFSDVTGDDDGTVTVTVTIADHVGNSASDAVVFNIDNTKPTVTLPSISESSDYLHADGLTIYYGDDMGSVQTFTVNGSSNDTGVGLDRATFSSAFGATPDDDTTPNTWSGRYYPDNQNWGNGTIYVTVYDLLDNAAFRTFHYIRDITPPVVDVTCPAVTSVPSFLVSWNNSADSPPDASGLNHLDVQYKVGSDGQWRDWLMDTSLAEATFGPTFPVIVEDNYTYYFLVRAEDNVSNEQQSNGEDATTYRSGVKKVFLPIVIAPDPNWGFETGNFTSWQHGGELAQSVSTDMPHSGNYSALLGSPSYPCNGVPIGSAWLRRSVTVPSSGSPTFSFYYRIFTQDKTAPEYLGVFDLGTVVPSGDRFAVEINGEQLFADANTTKKEICDPAHGILYPTPHDLDWQHGIVPLSNYKGQTIEITFHNYNWPDKWYNTYTYVDDVSVQW